MKFRQIIEYNLQYIFSWKIILKMWWKSSFILIIIEHILPSKHSSWWRRLSSLSSKDVFKTYSRRLCQDQYIRLVHKSSRRLQDVFKTFSRPLQDVFKTSCQDVLKTSSKGLQDVLQIRLEDIFKTFWRRITYHQVKLFLLASLWEVLNTFVRRTQKTVVCRRIHLGHTSEKFTVSVQNLQEWSKFLKF